MPLLRLQVSHLRNLNWIDLDLSTDLNLIYGANGSGKSSLLEAIYLLAHGRSFRCNSIRNVIARDADQLTVFSDIESFGNKIPIGIERKAGAGRIRIAGKNASSLGELLTLVPLQFIGPDIQKNLESGPKLRRTLIDWGVFHVEHRFYPTWLRYNKLLKQRNAALKKRDQQETIIYWDLDLAKTGELINEQRQSYLEKLKPYLDPLLTDIASLDNIELKLTSGWKDGLDLRDALNENLSRDLRYGFTSNGPHRCDLVFSYFGKPAHEILSRGQLKLLVIAFKIAQVQLLQKQQSQRCIILLDDLPSELDSTNRIKVMNELLDSGAQLFITTTDSNLIPFDELRDNKDKKMFHVEHGTVTEVI